MKIDRYEVHDARDHIVCGLHSDGTINPEKLRYWVARVGLDTFAFGSFICAALTKEEAQQIADALTLPAQAAILTNRPR